MKALVVVAIAGASVDIHAASKSSPTQHPPPQTPASSPDEPADLGSGLSSGNCPPTPTPPTPPLLPVDQPCAADVAVCLSVAYATVAEAKAACSAHIAGAPWPEGAVCFVNATVIAPQADIEYRACHCPTPPTPPTPPAPFPPPASSQPVSVQGMKAYGAPPLLEPASSRRALRDTVVKRTTVDDVEQEIATG